MRVIIWNAGVKYMHIITISFSDVTKSNILSYGQMLKVWMTIEIHLFML